jgi:hypothetical protein
MKAVEGNHDAAIDSQACGHSCRETGLSCPRGSAYPDDDAVSRGCRPPEEGFCEVLDHLRLGQGEWWR